MSTFRARTRSQRKRTPLRLLEPLEIRTLLSAAIQLSGNSTTIANGSTTPAVTDFTDFGPMSTTATDAIGTVTRTFTITNTGDEDLVITSDLVQISGDNAGDFAVTANSGDTISVGGHSDFTLSFIPSDAGARHATITIASNDPDNGTFTFDIEGMGLATTDSDDGLQVATITNGSGSGAVNGAHLTVSYVGMLTNGSIFDSTAEHGGTPFGLTLGSHSVIDGWEEGLLGMKLGETRVLIIPAALGYGDSPRDGIPAGSPLIFTVTNVTLEQPTIAVSGNNTAIAAGDTTPSTDDHTSFGTTAAGDHTPVTRTYKIAQSGAGALSFPTDPVVVLSDNSGNFTNTNLVFNNSAAFATFTVTYTPGIAGTQTAIVHIRSNDAANSDFTFKVAGTYTPNTTPHLVVKGGGVAIANHDITPAITDFTDFGPSSISFNAAIGRVSRTFNVINTGDPNLVLSGSPLVKITGTNASDFVLTVNTASTIPGQSQSGFTITFVPHNTGLRKATVTLLSNDPLAPTFTYSIQATAYATFNQIDGLQAAKMIAGVPKGSNAVNGAAVTVNYTGFLLTNKFESSLDPGGSPLTVVIGQSPVINGWHEGLPAMPGLLGIQPGETRLLEMPASLGYGSSPHGQNIPANSPLIFVITATTVLNPRVAISGHDIPIAFGDTTPTAVDGTFFGATPAGSRAPLTFTFKLRPGNEASLAFAANPPVVVVPKSPANFSASAVSIDNSGEFAIFTITYTPVKVGTETAVVHVRTTDTLHPDFIFTVAGTYTPFFDFAATSVAGINYPVSGTTVSGNGAKFTVPVVVTNLGNASVPGAIAPTQFNFYLHDINANTDTLISTQTSTSVRGTSAGKAKTVKFSLPIPITIPTGAYRMLVKINENHADAETSFSNNSFTSAQVINVTQGFKNVNGVLSASTFPASITGGVTLAGKLTTLVRNAGNLTLPSGQKYVLQTIAHNTSTDANTVIGASTITLSSWTPGKTGLFSVSTSRVGGLPAGSYEIRAFLTPLPALSESNTADNLVTTTALNAVIPLTVN